MSQEIFARLDSEVQSRAWEAERQELDKLSRVYEGELPAEYEKFFPKRGIRHIVGMIRSAWDDLATSTGRLPDLRGEPLNSSDAEMKRVGKLESIGQMYLRNSEPNGKLFMWTLAWWLHAGRAVAMVIPNKEKRIPVFTLRDPRTCYPGVKRKVGGHIIELSDLIFKYEVTVGEMERNGFAVSTTRDDYGRTTVKSKTDKAWMIEYIDDKVWIMASEGGTVRRTEHNLGVVPGWVFQTFAPNLSAGVSQFKDQVTFQVAISKIISQKLLANDKQINPMMWVRGHQGTLRVGPNVINKLGPQGEMGIISPPMTIQADQDVALLERLSRILNKNPDVRQGEVQSKGTYVSAKTVEQLAEAIDTVIGRHWDIIAVGMQELFACAFRMDEQMWPNIEKSLYLGDKGRKVREFYVPSKDINGRYLISVDYGFGLGGYQGFLQNMQANDAGVMSKRRVVESMPGVSDVDAELRDIELEALDEAGLALFQNQAASGQMDMILWAEIRKQMANKGMPLHEAIVKYQEKIQEQAAMAQQSGGTTASLTAPAPAPEAPIEEAPLPPGIPPSAMMAGV